MTTKAPARPKHSTGLRLFSDEVIFDDQDRCAGVAYGWESLVGVGEQEEYHTGHASARAKANARLWTAAPELLELVKEALCWFPEIDWAPASRDLYVRKAEAAIAKATGAQS